MTAEEYKAQQPNQLNVTDSPGFVNTMLELHRDVLAKQPQWIGVPDAED